MKAITISDVAKHANVSKSTVSQYLNKRFDYMGEKTKQRIEQSIQELGYSPNIVARSLKQKSTSTIGVIVANILHYFSTQVIRAIEDICHEYDFHIIVCNADDDPIKEKKYIEMLRAKQVDGIIAFPTSGNGELYQKMVDEKYPVIFIDRKIKDITIPSVMLDNEKASEKAVQHLISRGYEKIGILTTSIINEITPRIERIAGYRNTLEKHGLPVRKDYIKSCEVEDMQREIHTMLTGDDPPRAILAGNDLALMEILKYAKKNKLMIPNDLAVIGIDELSFASLNSPPLTTIAQPTFEMGKKAAELLLDEILKKKEKKQQYYRFEPEIIERESC